MKYDMDELIQKVMQFRDDRNWSQFHSLKDLLMGLNIEVGELQELFLWKSDSEVEAVDRRQIEHELADITIFLLYICQHFDIDLSRALSEKLEINAQKYTVEKSRDSNKKYTEL